MKFEISPENSAKIAEFKKQVEASRIDNNAGAIGGATTYSFTPTGLGVIFKVTHFDKELDLTNYEDW
jgi:hypothetical protein